MVCMSRNITQLEETKSRLHEREETLQRVLETTADVIAMIRVSDGVVVEANDAFVDLGYRPEDLVGKPWTDFAWTNDDNAQLKEFFRRLVEDSIVRNAETTLVRKDGALVSVLLSGAIVESHGEKYAVVNTRDISHLKDAESRLRESEASFRKIFEENTDPMTIVDQATNRIVDANRALLRFYGLTNKGQIIGRLAHEVAAMPPDQLREIGKRIARDGEVRNMECEFPDKNGKSIPILFSVMRMELAGRPCLVTGARDISALKEAERKLADNELTLRTIFDSSPDAIGVSTLSDFRFLRVNRAFERMFGLSSADVIGRPASKFNIVADQAKLEELRRRLMVDGEVKDMEFPMTLGSGEPATMLVSAAVVEVEGTPCLVWMNRDVTKLKEIEQQLRAQIAERERTEQRLRESESILRKTVETSPDAITINRGSDGVYLSVNDSFVKLSGYTRDEILGRSERELRVGAQPAQIRNLVRRLGADSVVPNLECDVRRKNGEVVPCQISAVRTEIGSEDCVIIITRDISELKKFQTELIAAREAALAASQSKSEFLSSMSHEIRTPMNAIVGMAELLGQSSLTAEQSRYLNIMKSNGDALLDLINDILDLAKIESGRLKLDSIAFDLELLADKLGEMMAVRAHEKGLELAIRIDPSVPRRVIGDQLRLRQILINLLGNAIKFTHAGEVVLEVENVAPAPQLSTGPLLWGPELKLRFTVSDTGIGIPADKLDGIFSSFQQADSSTTRLYGGSGLGLAIVKRLVELYEGEITVRSEVGEGSSFSFTATFELGNAGSSSSPATPEGLKGVRILIVDDTAVNRLILRELFEHVGAEVCEAESGTQALSRLERALASGSSFRLLVVDGRMPDMDGIELVKRTKQFFEDNEECPPALLLLTSDDQPRKIAHLRAMGIDHYLVKPVRRAELMDAVAHLISRTSRVEASATAAKSTYDDLPALRILIADDMPVNRMVLRAYFMATPIEVDEAENGRIARAKFEARKYDLVLMDMRMPGEDGYVATRGIRAWEIANNRARTPIIALTASALQDDVERCLEAGCDSHLSKPVKRETLFEAIRVLARMENVEKVS
jgi:PAS domain S-box-containing protein